MKCTKLIFFGLVLIGLTKERIASAQCENTDRDRGLLIRNLKEGALAKTPVKYHALALNIELTISSQSADAVFPFAAKQQGKNVIVIPAMFPGFACKVAFVEYAEFEGTDKKSFDGTTNDAAHCLGIGRSEAACFADFANALENRYRTILSSQSPEKRRYVVSTFARFYNSLLEQVVMHEYAHFFLEHSSRIKAEKLSRADAEFEADMFAVMSATEVGAPQSAMFYLFDPLSQIESRTTKLSTKDYESSTCRAGNVAVIVEQTGLVPGALIDAALGGGFTSNGSPTEFRAIGADQYSRKRSVHARSCGRTTSAGLDRAFDELQHIYQRMDQDIDLLYSVGTKVDMTRINRLAIDLATMSMTFQYMNGMAAKCLSMILVHWELTGRVLISAVSALDNILDQPTVIDNFMSEDYGSLLEMKGLFILEKRVDMTAKMRLDKSYSLLQSAVFYNPAQVMSWENLAFIALKRGDCKSASHFAENGVATLTEGKKGVQDSVEGFAELMKQAAVSPKLCAAKSTNFHPYSLP